MQAVISLVYYLTVLWFGFLLFRGFLRARNLQQAILYLVVLAPFVLRLLRVK